MQMGPAPGKKSGRLQHGLVWLFFGITLGSGLINLGSVMGGPGLAGRLSVLEVVFPIEVIHYSRFLTLLIGFILVITSLQIIKRKRQAMHLAVLLSLLSAIFNLGKGLDYEEASLSLALAIGLFLSRSLFTVKSGIPDWKHGFFHLLLASALVFGYGVLGFWLVEEIHFGIDYPIGESFRHTLIFLTLNSDPDTIPQTRYAQWFLDSLYLAAWVGLTYVCIVLFRPALYRFYYAPAEYAAAARIIKAHGKSSLDFFKNWPDKTLYFSPSRNSFLAYRVGRGMAVVLADPVGPEEELEDLIRCFSSFCRENDWGLAFHQALPDYWPIYQRLGFRRIKIGDDAIVDLSSFSLQGKEKKKLRNHLNQMEKTGIRTKRVDPPITEEVLREVQEVSQKWLKISGRRERRFTLGLFSPSYIQTTPLFLAQDPQGHTLAFVNLIPSYHPGEATIDLMRYRTGAPNGIMDYLFCQLFFHLKEQGYLRFNLGMAPLAGFQEKEQASLEERAIHFFLQRMEFLFSFSGLRQYKGKFADVWEPRYTVYFHALDLPRLALALPCVSEIRGGEWRSPPHAWSAEGHHFSSLRISSRTGP